MNNNALRAEIDRDNAVRVVSCNEIIHIDWNWFLVVDIYLNKYKSEFCEDYFECQYVERCKKFWLKCRRKPARVLVVSSLSRTISHNCIGCRRRSDSPHMREKNFYVIEFELPYRSNNTAKTEKQALKKLILIKVLSREILMFLTTAICDLKSVNSHGCLALYHDPQWMLCQPTISFFRKKSQWGLCINWKWWSWDQFLAFVF